MALNKAPIGNPIERQSGGAIPKRRFMMKGTGFLRVVLLMVLGVFLVTSIGEAREIKGKTKFSSRNLVVSAIATDGSATTVPVTFIRKRETDSGTVFIGKYSLEVPDGQKVMIVFQKLRKRTGTLKPKTVARFAKDVSGLTRTTQLNVTQSPLGGSEAIDLGAIRVKRKFAKPKNNPLEDVDNDGDGTSDFDDEDDDNDGIEDNQDEDEDGNGEDDQGEDMDEDDDGKPDVVDPDDDDDGIRDKDDLDDDNDGIDDWDGDTDSDDDGVEDADDPDDDNDGIEDNQDMDQDGDGIPDQVEQDSDGDGIPDDCDEDDDNDGIDDSQDEDNDNDGILDDDEQDSDGDGIPDDSDEDDDNDGIPDYLDDGQ
jgi:hypothetical protein